MTISIQPRLAVVPVSMAVVLLGAVLWIMGRVLRRPAPTPVDRPGAGEEPAHTDTRRCHKRRQEALGEINVYVEEMVTGARVRHVYARHAPARQRGLRRGGLLQEDSLRAKALFIIYSRQFMQSIRDLSNQWNTFQFGLAGAERVLGIMGTESEAAVPGAHGLRLPVSGHVKFEHVLFGHRPGVPVLTDIHLEAEPGQTIALMGATGSGETTIVSLLSRFYDIDRTSAIRWQEWTAPANTTGFASPPHHLWVFHTAFGEAVLETQRF